MNQSDQNWCVLTLYTMTETKCFRDALRDQLHELSGQPNNSCNRDAVGNDDAVTAVCVAPLFVLLCVYISLIN